jgi:tetratricopeptide (TPR) repeat protein
VVFERLVQGGGPEGLARAVDLYRGDLVEGLAFRGALFEDWLMAERERLRELALDALAKLLAHQRSAGSAEAALQTALRLIALDPLQEAVHRTIMRLYAQLGRRGAALRQYRVCLGVLQRELGVEPEADTRQLYQEILPRRPPREPGAATIPGITELKPFLAPPVVAATATPLIGRAGEMTRLREALAQARAGAGQLLAIVGEAGVGKTRLIVELATEALPRDTRLLLGRCYESDQILPFGPWVDALRTSRVTSDSPLLDELAPPWRAELARLLPEVEVPGLPMPGDNQLRLFEGMAQLLERLAARQPVLLVLEDLHWADEMTLRLLAFVTRRIPPWRLLLVVTAREEELPEASAAHHALQELGAQAHAGRLALRPLSRADTRRLIEAVARAGSDARALARMEEQVWAASEGNPFVAVEMMRALQEGSLPPDTGTLPLPDRVHELIAGRLGRLSDRAQELAAVAAVIGREFDFSLLERAGGLDEHTTAAGVEELVRRHVMRGVGERFEFTHHRVHAVVQERQLAPQRRLRHRHVGEALEALYAGSLEPHYLALGIHFREGEVRDKAVDFFRRAGARAMARSASREAVACFGQALDALEHLPKTADTIRVAIDLRLDLQSGYLLLGELPRMLDSLCEAEDLAKALEDDRRMARVWAHMAACFWYTGQLESAVDYSQRALAIATALGDRSLEVLASVRLSLTYVYMGEYPRAIEVINRYTEALTGDLASERFEMPALPAVNGRLHLVSSFLNLGDFAAAAAAADKALEIATAVDHPHSVAIALYIAGRWRACQGNFNEAIPWLERSLEACRGEGLYSAVAAFTGGVYARAGRPADGIALHGEAAKRGAAIGFEVYRPEALISRAGAYLSAGRVEEALRVARQGLDLSRAGKQRGCEAATLHILGEIQARQQPPHEAGAEEFYQRALALAEELGMRPLVAHCHLGLSKLYRRVGERQQAHEHLTTAIAMYRAMDMRFWLEKAEAEVRASG